MFRPRPARCEFRDHNTTSVDLRTGQSDVFSGQTVNAEVDTGNSDTTIDFSDTIVAVVGIRKIETIHRLVVN